MGGCGRYPLGSAEAPASADASDAWEVKKHAESPIDGVERWQGLVRKLDLSEKVVYSVLSDSDATKAVRYGKLLIATGLKPQTLGHVDESVASHVSPLRSFDDFNRIKEWWSSEKPLTLTVVGAGLLGPELVWAMAKNNPRGHKLQLVCESERVMDKVWPRFLSEEATRRIGALGVKIIPRSEAVAVVNGGDGRAFVQLADESRVESDRVVLAMGARPDPRMFIRAGLEIDEERGGVVANAELQLRSDVWAAGDVVSFYDTNLGERRRIEHHEHAFWSGVVAAKNMMGKQMAYSVVPVCLLWRRN